MQVRILPPLPPSSPAPSLTPTQWPAYAYLFGVYLGDGHVTRYPRTYRLEIYLGARETRVIRHTTDALRCLLPQNRVGRRYRPSVIVVNAYSRWWPRLFPQHGPGRKHTRRIVLEAWQREILAHHPGDFIRGCLDSDGCRHRRIVRGRNYPAYAFRNRSADILTLFTEACDAAGLRWRRASAETISIARRPDVARLDALMAQTTPGAHEARDILTLS